jgi:hypothetical protein
MREKGRRRRKVVAVAVVVAVASLAGGAVSAEANTVNVSVTGNGSVRDDSGTIDCPAVNCSRTIPPDTQVTLTATPGSGSTFESWAGNCEQFTGNTCIVSGKTPNDSVVATFSAAPPPEPFGLTISPSAPGRFTSTPAGIDCNYGTGLPGPAAAGRCAASFPPGTRVTITPAFPDGWRLASWRGTGTPCVAAPCTFVMDGNRTVGALIVERSLQPGELRLRVQGQGFVVRRGVTGFRCPPSCTVRLARGESTTFVVRDVSQLDPAEAALFPEEQREFTFDHWEGTCARLFEDRTCTVSGAPLDTRTTTAVFRPFGNLQFSVRGNGSVRSNHGGSAGGFPDDRTRTVDCPGRCSVTMRPGFSYAMFAVPDPGFVFDHWEGSCSNIFSLEPDFCVPTEAPGRHRSVAVFRRANRGEGDITTIVQGPGAIFNSSRRICPGTCLENFVSDPDLRSFFLYEARPVGNARFVRWEGCPREVTSTSPDRPDRQDCAPAPVRVFTAARTIRAIFAAQFAVTFDIAGRGRVRDDAGVVCPGQCTQTIRNPGGDVTFRAAPRPGYFFDHWEGYCGRLFEDETCRVNGLSQNVSTRAVFRGLGQTTFTLRGSGTVSGPGLTCRATTCTGNAALPGRSTRYTADAAPGFVFDRWEGYCHWIFENNTCDVPGGADSRTSVAIFRRA